MINWKKITKLYPEKIKQSGYRAWTSEEISKMICNNVILANGGDNTRNKLSIYSRFYAKKGFSQGTH